ncbi:YdeI/OmpD-associated family protein [Paucibacter sp. DJ1R-11]|uniref:YdeI/OmpD-associated family protein n=1 Tax=Paucibacter sp. DJ1R-11 TaxID=2893556 RepID=UPI0021E4C906|nr:YdeI/OmpD-associated family protein [Paucibacter sp. DJ1R-11]MCV2363914.1 YdeI/OmpD-associated family protein [Paucibacter sp. DJ1R-11]
MSAPAPQFFATAADFRAWLDAHAASASELRVGFYKRDSGLPSMSWPESVDEALCHGWIDGVRQNIDAQSYQIRFTPRRPGSIWSAINLAKMQRLLDQGRVHAAGVQAFAQRREERTAIYAYEQSEPAQLSEEELRRFQESEAAWRYWAGSPPGYRRQQLYHVCSAKRPATRAARLAHLIGLCAQGLRWER